jgi:2-dehydro-3-deoxyphosphogluconate aldolase/(4S)-4-hydroxy-2-oxoglutarate aldolase
VIERQQIGSHTRRLASHGRKPGTALSKTKLTEAISEIGIIVTVRVPNEQHILRVASALLDGGIRALELSYITNRSVGSLIQELKESGLLIGIGAVTRSPQAREARAFGADFITASVTTPDVVSACEEMKIPAS